VRQSIAASVPRPWPRDHYLGSGRPPITDASPPL